MENAWYLEIFETIHFHYYVYIISGRVNYWERYMGKLLLPSFRCTNYIIAIALRL